MKLICNVVEQSYYNNVKIFIKKGNTKLWGVKNEKSFNLWDV